MYLFQIISIPSNFCNLDFHRIVFISKLFTHRNIMCSSQNYGHIRISHIFKRIYLLCCQTNWQNTNIFEMKQNFGTYKWMPPSPWPTILKLMVTQHLTMGNLIITGEQYKLQETLKKYPQIHIAFSLAQCLFCCLFFFKCISKQIY